MNTIRDEINRMKWHTTDLERARVEYIHREGTTEGTKVAHGIEITNIRGWFFTHTDVDGEEHFIPYHRVVRLYRGDAMIWERPERAEAE